MSLEYQEAVGDRFNYATDWMETCTDQQAGGGHFTIDVQEDVRTGIVPWNKLRSAMRYFLGYTYCDVGSPYLLHRENPSPHPTLPWLFAYDFVFAGIGPQSNGANPANQPYVNSPFYGSPDQLRSTQYSRAMCTVRYRSYKYRHLKDSDVSVPSDEWMRSCFIECDNQLDVLTVDGVGQLQFAESTGTPGQGPALKTPFPAPLPTLLPKGEYTLNWYGLPFGYLSSDSDVFYPAKILKCLGKVNSKDFIVGDFVPFFPAGTVLMKALKYTVFPWPVAAADVTRPLLGVHVSIPLEYFDPAKGVPGSTYHGHNLMPWRGAPGDLTGGKFFYATRGGNATDPPLLDSFDFNNLFYHVNAAYLP